MHAEHSDQRATPRAQFFLVRQPEAYVSIFAFRGADDTEGIPALVTDLSAGGLQILSSSSDPLNAKRYTLHLVLSNADEAIKSPPCEITSVWSREEGMYTKRGFAFVENTPLMAAWMDAMDASEHHLLRCVLHPLN